MSRLISSIATSELSNLNFVDLNEQEMITLTGGEGSLVDVDVNAENAAQYAAQYAAQNALKNANIDVL